MKSFFHCETCGYNDLEFNIHQHCEECDMQYDLYCIHCECDIREFSLRDLKEYIKKLERRI